MRLITISLAGLLLLIQYPLWFGKGGWLWGTDLAQQVDKAKKRNADLKARNAKLESEVRDLNLGTEAVEERARYELGMIKKDEIFIHVVNSGLKPNAAANAAQNPTPAQQPAQPVQQKAR